jgi:hypothetical protein
LYESYETPTHYRPHGRVDDSCSSIARPLRRAKQEKEMNNLPIDRQDSDEGILNYQVSDQALERAAAAPSQGVGSFTIAYCTQHECPIGD